MFCMSHDTIVFLLIYLPPYPLYYLIATPTTDGRYTMPATTPQDREQHVLVAICQTTRDVFVHADPTEITLWSDGRGPVEITHRGVSHAD